MATVKTYAHHTPTPETLEAIKLLRKGYSDLHKLLSAKVGPSRELSLAYTSLEQSAMWAIKALVCNHPESVVEDVG